MPVQLLGQENYEVTAVKTVSEAPARARAESFSLCVPDEWLPRDAGLGLCRKIREFDRHTPIVFYSGAATDSDKEEALYAGAQAFVAKPRAEELIPAVHRQFADRPEPHAG
jgi:two-component system, OmpR family, response regulator